MKYYNIAFMVLLGLFIGGAAHADDSELMKMSQGNGYVSTKSIDELKDLANKGNGYLSTPSDEQRGNQRQATALVKFATNLPATGAWRAGEAVTTTNLEEGTAIAVFNKDGTYGNSKDNFACIFVSYVTDKDDKVTGIKVIEQFSNVTTGILHEKVYRFDDKGAKFKAGDFSIITLK